MSDALTAPMGAIIGDSEAVFAAALGVIFLMMVIDKGIRWVKRMV